MTVTPWTLAKRRRKATSLATPFCRHTIGVDGGATAASDSTTPDVSWLFTATTTTSSGPNVSSAGEPTTGTGRVTEPSGHSTVRPPADHPTDGAGTDEHDPHVRPRSGAGAGAWRPLGRARPCAPRWATACGPC